MSCLSSTARFAVRFGCCGWRRAEPYMCQESRLQGSIFAPAVQRTIGNFAPLSRCPHTVMLTACMLMVPRDSTAEAADWRLGTPMSGDHDKLWTTLVYEDLEGLYLLCYLAIGEGPEDFLHDWLSAELSDASSQHLRPGLQQHTWRGSLLPNVIHGHLTLDSIRARMERFNSSLLS